MWTGAAAFGEADETDAERLELRIEASPFRVSNHVIERAPA
jgi:hypothetical protein